ncbi:type VI secretion system tip protein VgrG, partial [Pseudomonas aeruginosa]|nr:type VI secretion system tip protein VgrG [Pseudomonas aeruginosa]
MFAPANQTHFSLRIENLRHDFQVLAFRGREAISQPFRFDLELVSERSDLDLDALLHQPAFLILSPSGQGVHGQLTSIAQGDSGKRLTGYRATLEPRLAYLGLCSDQRIFQRLSVPEIIGRVLEGHGILADAYRFQLGPTPYPAREYCTQYDETDLAFLSRLCEEEGIHYHHEFSAQGHVLVFGDDQTSFPRLQRPVAYVQDAGLVADQPVVKRFGVRFDTRASRVTRRDYDFEQPALQMQAAHGPQLVAQQPDLEDYDYPGRFTHRERGKHLSRRALERHRADYLQARGESD